VINKITEPKIWKEIAIHSLYFNAFLELWMIISEKCVVIHFFSFWIPVTLAKIYFSPIVKTFAKKRLY